MPSFHRHHYNFVAKRLRENFPLAVGDETGVTRVILIAGQGMVSDIAYNFAQKFAEDNPDFNPTQFLDQCSPDPDRYPLSELWED